MKNFIKDESKLKKVVIDKKINSIRAELALGLLVYELHLGGASGKEDHPDGSPQKVHGGDGKETKDFLSSSKIKISRWENDEFNKIVEYKIGLYGAVYIRINGNKDGSEGEYSLYIDFGGNENLTINEDGKFKFGSSPKIKGTAEEVINIAIKKLETSKNTILQKVLPKMAESVRDDYLDLISAYHRDANQETYFDMIDSLKRPAYRAVAMEDIDKLPFDENGEILLFRGGNENGVSWSIDEREAERFARYGFGGVPIQASGQIGIAAIKSGAADKEIFIHKRKFSKKDILASLLRFREGEVIIDPDALLHKN